MSMTKEIEKIFQHVIENDLARISRCAAPSYHFTTYAPMSMFQLQSQQEQVDPKTNAIQVSLSSQDYQVVRIELDPLEAHRDTPDQKSKTRLGKIRDRRRDRRGLTNTDFDNKVNAAESAPAAMKKKLFDEAYHEYIEDTDAQGPIPILSRSMNIDPGPPCNVKREIISVAGVDYIHEDVINNQADFDRIKDKINKQPLANVDQWPEEVVLRHHSNSNDDVTYVRYDVEFWDAQGNKVSLRLRD